MRAWRIDTPSLSIWNVESGARPSVTCPDGSFFTSPALAPVMIVRYGAFGPVAWLPYCGSWTTVDAKLFCGCDVGGVSPKPRPGRWMVAPGRCGRGSVVGTPDDGGGFGESAIP